MIFQKPKCRTRSHRKCSTSFSQMAFMMRSSRLRCGVATCLSLLAVLPSVYGHMELSWPPPIRSKYNSDTSSSDIDYNMMAPLKADGSDFPCKGYQNDRPAESVTTYQPGQAYNMTLAGSATHGGGSCKDRRGSVQPTY